VLGTLPTVTLILPLIIGILTLLVPLAILNGDDICPNTQETLAAAIGYNGEADAGTNMFDTMVGEESGRFDAIFILSFYFLKDT
jgi:hypothetical protein